MRRLILKAKPEARWQECPRSDLAAALVAVIIGQWGFFFAMPPDEVCRQLYYPGESFVESVEIADYIKSHSVAGDQIAIVGSEPQICFLRGPTFGDGLDLHGTGMMDGQDPSQRSCNRRWPARKRRSIRDFCYTSTSRIRGWRA